VTTKPAVDGDRVRVVGSARTKEECGPARGLTSTKKKAFRCTVDSMFVRSVKGIGQMCY